MWQKGIELVAIVYKITASFPEEEKCEKESNNSSPKEGVKEVEKKRERANVWEYILGIAVDYMLEKYLL